MCIRDRVEWLQQRLFILEPIHGSLVRFTMETDIGDARQPHLGGRVHRTEVEEVSAIQQVLFDIAHAVFDPPVLIAFRNVAGRDDKPPMTSEIQILRIEDRRFAYQAAEHLSLIHI